MLLAWSILGLADAMLDSTRPSKRLFSHQNGRMDSIAGMRAGAVHTPQQAVLYLPPAGTTSRCWQHSSSLLHPQHPQLSQLVQSGAAALSCRLLSVGDKPGHDFFRLLAQKLEEYQVPMPTVQIEYKNLTVKTQAMVGSAGIPTAGNFGPQLLKVSMSLEQV